MKFWQKIICFNLIVLPLAASILLPLSPMPMEYLEASKNTREAFLSGETATEIENTTTILQYTPWRGDLWQRLGRLYLNQGKIQDAADSFAKAREKKQLDPQGKIWLADTLLTLGEKDQARQILRELDDEEDVFILMQTASLQRKLNDTFGALSTLLHAYPLDSLNSELNYQLGIQLAAQEPDSASQYLQPAIHNIQRQYGAQALLDLLSQTADIAGTPERFIYIGQLLSKIEEWDVAARAFQNAVSLAPDNAEALALLGEAQQQMGEDGFPSIKQALELAPDSETVNGLAALYYRRQGKPEVALVYLKKASTANPNTTVWEIEMGNTLAEMGKLEDALKHYRKAVEMNPSDWISWRALAMFSISRNYEVNIVGIEAARQALLLNPGSPPLLDLMGTGLMLLGDLDSAERFFLQADNLDPNQAAILIHLGQLKIYQGKKEEAFAYFRRAAEAAEEARLRDMANRLLLENGGK